MRWQSGLSASLLCLLVAGCTGGDFPSINSGSTAPHPADARRGAKVFDQRCAECHSVTFEDMGPHLGGVIGRKAGSVPKFRYSAGLAKASFVWDDAHLDAWLRDPESLVPGQRMKEHVSDPAKRADLIAYLHTLSH